MPALASHECTHTRPPLDLIEDSGGESERRFSLNKVDLARQRQEIERLRVEMAAKSRDERRVVTRARARILQDTHLEGRMGRFVVHADEPPARGGTDKGASPLQFMMVATAF